MTDINLIKRNEQPTPLSHAQVDSNWQTIEDAVNELNDIKLEDAPNDGKQYARENQSWSEVVMPNIDQSLFPNGIEMITSTRNFLPTDAGKLLVLLSDFVGLKLPNSIVWNEEVNFGVLSVAQLNYFHFVYQAPDGDPNDMPMYRGNCVVLPTSTGQEVIEIVMCYSQLDANTGNTTNRINIPSTGILRVEEGERYEHYETTTKVVQSVGIGGGSRYIISGFPIWSGGGLEYLYPQINYVWNGVPLTALQGSVTLDTADVSFDRFDLIVLSEDGIVSVIKGTASDNPIIPTLPNDRLLLLTINVKVGMTEPNVISEIIYNENIEWATSILLKNHPNIPNDLGTIDFNNTNEFKVGAKSIHWNTNEKKIAIFKPASLVNPTDWTSLSMWIMLKEPINDGRRFEFQFYKNAGSATGNYIDIRTKGLNQTLLNTWQLITIPIADFNIPNGEQIERLIATFTLGSPDTIRDLYLDYIRLTTDVEQVIEPPKEFNVSVNGQLIGAVESINFIENENIEINGTLNDKTADISIKANIDNPNIHRFPKDVSLTESHIGLLAMQQVTVLNDPPSGVEDFEVKAVLSNTTPEIIGTKGEYEIELKGIFEVPKSDIIDNWENWNFTYHLTNVGSAIFDLRYLFDATKGNAYGTDDGTGFLEFADNTEKQNALDWCLGNSSADTMSDYFDILTPFYYDAISESFKAVVRQKSIPLFYAYFTDNSFNFGSSFNGTAIVEYVKTIAEQVKSYILGTIVGIDEDEVLIDTSSVQTLKMASVADGAFSTLPVPLGSEIGDLILLPWRNGTVIDLFGYSLTTNYNPTLEENFFFFNGYFRPLTKAGAEENVIAKMM